jgi:two-component system sensor histidine kinase RegB
MLLLTGLLGLTGGASNPFSVVYLVHITLAAVMLGSRWTRGLAALAITCYAVLFLGDSSATAPHSETDLRNHLQGMWVAFAAAAILVAYFVARLSAELERRDADVTEMRLRVARQQRLASVTTLAAGAAHELGTPLATIAVASVELERAIRNLPPALAGTLREDTELIRAEVGRCREILARLASNAGQSPGETPALVSIRELAAQLALGLPPERRARLRLEGLEADLRHTATREALTQVARNLLENAFEAGEGDVCLRFESSGPRLRMIVRDDGRGMTPEELSRAGEPFFSTKQPGAGLGLGLFIARSLTEQMGGRLRIASRPGAGTTVTVDLDGTAAEAGGHRDA